MKTLFEKIQRTHKQEEIFDRIQAEYDKLCPKPSKFGDSKYCKINEDFYYRFYDSKIDSLLVSIAENYDDIRDNCEYINLPLGIDWRLCRWTIEDAKRIHGEEE